MGGGVCPHYARTPTTEGYSTKKIKKSVRRIQLLNSNQTASDVVAGYVRLGDDSCHRRIMVWVVGYVRIHARTPATEGYSMKKWRKE